MKTDACVEIAAGLVGGYSRHMPGEQLYNGNYCLIVDRSGEFLGNCTPKQQP